MTAETPSDPSSRGWLLLVAMAGLAVAVALPAFSLRPAVWAEELGGHRQSRALRAFTLRPPYPTYAWAWGGGEFGKLGDGIEVPELRPTPALVLNLTEVTAIAAGMFHSLAAKRDGTVWAWGGNNYGELGVGDPTIHASPIPVQVLNLSGVTAVATSADVSLALKNDGTVWALARTTSAGSAMGPPPAATRRCRC
jgi:hypothetical protein